MQKFEVEIEGITPYMQHKMNDAALEQWEKQRGFIIERPDINKDDISKATYHMYLDDKGKPFLPSEHIRGSMIMAGGFVKSKVGNAKKSMKNVVAAMFFVTPEQIKLSDDWVIDKRSAVNRIAKARIISIRPKWEKWTAKFTISVDNDTITSETVKQILEYAGQYVGIGSFSPRCNGMFGRFKINQFKIAA